MGYNHIPSLSAQFSSCSHYFVNVPNIRFKCKLVTVLKSVQKNKKGCAAECHTEVNMEATEVSVYTFIYKVMCHESQMRIRGNRAKQVLYSFPSSFAWRELSP